LKKTTPKKKLAIFGETESVNDVLGVRNLRKTMRLIKIKCKRQPRTEQKANILSHQAKSAVFLCFSYRNSFGVSRKSAFLFI